MRRLIIGLFTAAVLFILFVVLCTYVRRPYEKIIVVRFGSLIDEQNQTRMVGNWYLKWPTDSVERIDTRLHLKTLPYVEFPTNKAEPVSVRAYVVWHITDPRQFKLTTNGSDDRAEELISAAVRSLIQKTMGKHSLNEFFNTDPKTEAAVRDMETAIARDATVGTPDTPTEKGTPGLRDLGIEIADVGFSRIAFPPQNTDAVYTRMVADLNQKSRQYEAEGLAQANIIMKDGVAEAAKIRAEAVAKAEGIRGGGDREALRLLADVAKTDAQKDFYEYWKSLDFLKASFAKNTIMVLSTDSPLWKRLFNATQLVPDGAPSSGSQNTPSAPAATLQPERK